ncbi:MAG TPA: DUF4340 domain-containing protein [Opitutaceae bacterium]|nr:DUF4340 domain-containing protein [Opitutaceae bacterium]
MRTKITLILLFLNVVLFAFIFYIEPRFQAENSFNQAGSRVLGPEASNITALAISSRTSPQPLRIEKHGDAWLLSQPAGWPANVDAVNRILTELQTLRHETSFLVGDLARNGQTLADYGLDQPQLTVTFISGSEETPGGGKSYTLRIGANTAVGNNLYVLSPDGRRIHVVSRSLADSLTIPPDQFQDDRLFTIPVFEASGLNIQTAGPPVRIQRAGDRWSIINPILARASKTLTELAITDLDTLRAQSFVSDRDADDRAGLGTPALRLTLDGNNRRETLLLGNTAPNPAPAGASAKPDRSETLYYAKMEDKAPVFVVSFPDTLLDQLKNAKGTLRETHFFAHPDHSAFDFDPSEVTTVTLRAPNHDDLTVQRLESTTTGRDVPTWQIVRRTPSGPQTQPADAGVMQHLLENLSLLSAKKFVSDAPAAMDLENWGFNRPEREITLTLASPAPPAAGLTVTPPTLTLQLGLGTDAQVYARLSGSASVYAVDPAILAATPVTPLIYRDRLLQELPAGAQIIGLKLTRLTDKTILYEKAMTAPPDNAAVSAFWNAALAAEPADRGKAIGEILKLLPSLRAKNFVRDDFPPSITVAGETRPWSYELDATIALAVASGAPATTENMQLFFTERVGGGTQLAGSPKLGVVFEADQPLLDALYVLATPPPAAPPPTPAAPPTTPAAPPPSSH